MKPWKDLQLFAEGGEGGQGSEGAEGAVEGAAPGPQAPAPVKATWEELMEDPDYRRRLEETVQARLAEAREAPQGAEVPQEAEPPGPEEESQALQAHFRSLEEQGRRLKELYPGFDLVRELQNPAFARMTHPRVGIPVEDAYFALHREELQGAAMAAAARKTAQKLSQAIQSGSLRPREAGSAAPSFTTFREGQTKEQREALKKRIREAAARGEKVYPQGW